MINFELIIILRDGNKQYWLNYNELGQKFY